ncbi:N-acyl homoserine lactonase family protein [Aurantimonas sp. MSK8Z-1]|uniref:N-acyl homoserine lactonase family protein n=1 Tax=Mangrovibrevibacter kandeliae TaxID=2968473 RepID=UPI002118C897|nr:N-acyl homoserine lactonase family protein [Aurantimonas sp. MSK8Z-1]MCW4115498.1 N-acyl homoserine lactonase family protein [Aurantimonas sp. MSK8Z-1]
MRKLVSLAAAALIEMVSTAARAEPPAAEVRLYTLDCGRIDFDDLKVFSDTGEHDGESGVLPVSCFLIRHGDDWLLWDAGLGDEIAGSPTGRVVVGLHFRVPRTLVSQLAELGLKPDDIHYVGLSHLHADHSGNVALFPHATFLIAPAELQWASGTPTPDGVLADRVAAVRRSRIQPVPGDLDLFGDGTVRLLTTPGHTPGHQSLLVRLQKAGTILISGDAAHSRLNYENELVPLGNVSRAETIASIERLKGLAAHFHARVIIEHAADVFDTTPRLPAYLD